MEHLNLGGNLIKDDGVIELSKVMPQLKALGLRDTGVSDRGLISMSFQLPELT